MPDRRTFFLDQLRCLGFRSLAFQSVGLAIWVGLAIALRCHNLTLKPLWTDEFSTLVFSLGHSFQSVPLDRAIAIGTLLAPLHPAADTTVADTARHLLQESNHPPLYFVLTHLWLSLFRGGEGYVSVWGARSLSVVFGVAAVPALYSLGWLTFRSFAVAQLAAALMAVSPFGLYLSQEARHYTLAMAWIIASLACLMEAVRHIQQRKPLPLWIVGAWIVTNGLGIATHYFFLLTLLAEMVVLIGAWTGPTLQIIQKKGKDVLPHLKWVGLGRTGLAIAGTMATCLVWLPFLTAIRQGDELTQWIYEDSWSGLDWIDPLLHTLASVTSMIYLLPVQNVERGVAIASGVGIAGLSLGTAWLVYRGLRKQTSWPDGALSVQVLIGFGLGAIAIIGFMTYGLGIDLAQVFRYHFVYFPAVILLVAAGLVSVKDSDRDPSELVNSSPSDNRTRSRRFYSGIVVLILSLSILGSLTVSSDLGYRKLHRPDRVVAEIAERYEVPVLVAISHQTHGQTGRLMALAWEMRSPAYADTIQQAEFFLDHQGCALTGEQNCNTPSRHLRKTLDTYPKPFDLWLINYEGKTGLKAQGCAYRTTKRTDGYKFQQYECHS